MFPVSIVLPDLIFRDRQMINGATKVFEDRGSVVGEAPLRHSANVGKESGRLAPQVNVARAPSPILAPSALADRDQQAYPPSVGAWAAFKLAADSLPKPLGALSKIAGCAAIGATVGIAAMACINMGISQADDVFQRGQVNAEAHNIGQISAGIKNFYAARAHYAGVDNDILLQARIIPERMVGGGSSIINEWKGAVVAVEGAERGTYSISYDGVPAKSCALLVTLASEGFISASIDGALIFERENYQRPVEIDLVKLAAACALNPKGSTLVFSGR